MPKQLVVENGVLVCREVKVPPLSREERIFLKYQAALIKEQEKIRKEIPFADGRTRNIVFDV